MAETLAVLYQDDDLVAVHKPSGLLVHRSDIDRHETRFALQIVRDQLGQRVWATHRLDKGTSGILLFALHPEAASLVGQQFEHNQVAKRYQAVVRGHPPAEGCIDHPLKRVNDPYARSPDPTEAAQTACTRYRRLACWELPWAVDRYPSSRYAHLELQPETGRQHQLRRHLKHIAHPIIGDATYGKGKHNRMFSAQFGSQRLMLACTELHFTHPRDGRQVCLHTAPAADYLHLIVQLDAYRYEATA